MHVALPGYAWVWMRRNDNICVRITEKTSKDDSVIMTSYHRA